MKIPAWTDSSIRELGDKSGRPGPIREVTIVQYDGGETAHVVFKDITVAVKIDRLYMRSKRASEAPAKPKSSPPAKLPSQAMVVDSAYIRIKNSKPDSPDSVYNRIRNPYANLA